MTHRIVDNEDNDDLAPLIVGPGLIGSIPEVNGNEAIEEPEFVPTQHELIELAR